MRRRILSAFMAFALALTLLPTSAMALGSDQDPNQKALENGAEGNYVSFEFITSAPGEYHGVSLFGVDQSDTYPDSGKYFGSQLNGAAEKIYGALEAFFADSKNATTGTADFTIELDQGTDSTFAEVADALAAFDRDHSEVFWTGLGGISTNGTTVSIKFPTSATWGADAQRTIAGDQAAVETAVGKLAEEATAASPTNRYVQLKYVHDWLVNNNKYGEANDSNLHYQWEAIGALDMDIDPVCEAYSRAFKLVCDKLSIPCVLVSGTADGPHMWNYVQMEDNNWYLVDITWDDPVTEDGSGVLRYDYFLVGSKNKGNREENTNFISVDNKYNDAFRYPTLSAEDYSVTDKPKHNLTGIPTEGVKLEFGTTDTVNVTSSTGGTVSWSSSDDTTVSVANGMLTAKKVGAATITVTASGGDTYADNVQTFTVTVTAKDLKDATVTINPENFTYTGTAQTPDVVVTVGESTLGETDYTVSYENNTDVGTATLTITGRANYTGTVTKTFEIKQAESKATEVQVTDPNPIYTTTDVSKVQLTGKVTLANDNSVEVTSRGTFAITAPEKFEEGKNTCTWTWTPNADTAKNVKSCTGTIEITATGRTVSSITVSALPTKTTYVYGEEFDPAGLVLDVTYNDSATPEKVTWSESSGITFSPESGLGEVGAKKVVVIYGEKTVDISVTVVPKTISLDPVHWTVPQTSISYDGKEHTGATLTGTIPAELTEKSRTGDKGTNAGTYTPSVTFELANGLTANNYTLPEDLTVTGTTWEIAAGTMTGKDIVRNVKYDATGAQTVTAADFGITVSGVTAELGTMTPDTAIDVQKIETNSISFVPKSGLTAPDTPIEVKVPVTFKAANYEDCTVTLTVNVVSKNVPDLTVNDYTKTYDGKAVTMDDLADRLTAAFNDQTVSGSWAAVDSLPTDAGEYSCTLSFAPEDTETYVSGQTRVIKITINKANATVTANSYEIAIGEALPEYDYTVTGATKETLGCTPKLTCDATADSPAGEYPITFSSKPEAKNYNITWVDGTLTIKAAVTPAAPAAPTASPASGTTFTDSVRVTLNAAEGAEIYYTLDGSEPTYVPVRAAGGTTCRYSDPITLTETTTIKAIAVKDGRTSEVATFTYTKQPQTPVDPDPQPPVQQAATPVIEPAGGQFYTSVQVRITCTTPGATVYYALDGGTYNVYTAPFTLYGSTTVRAYATAPGMTDSNPASAYFSRYTAPVTPDPDPDPEPDDNYEPPASGTTGGSQSPTRPSTPTQPTKPTQPAQPETPAVPEVTTRPEAAVDGGTASAAVTPEAAEQLVEQAVSGRSDTLVIAPVIGGDVTKTEVKLPASAASAIAKETNAAVRVETPVANVTISNQGLAGLSSRGGEIAVTAEKTAGGVDVAVTVDGQRVENMPIKASVPTPCGPGTVAKIVDENGNVLSTVRKSSASADGQTMNLSLSGSAKVVFVEGSKTFTDIPADNWAAGAVAFASSHELMNGVSEQTFSPSQPMTRGMLAVVLHNLEGNPGASYKGGFSDVQVSAWYAEAVQWASEQKIVSGLSDGVFAPNSPITREQLVVMLYRYVGQPTASGSSLGRFSDAQNVSSWAAEAMNWAVSNGIVNGSNGALNPQGSATRAEVAQMLLNFVSSGVL